MRSIKRQKGVNLIELMIVGFLMVLVSFFMMKIMTTANQTAAHTDGIAQAQETARLATYFLYKGIRRSGYSRESQMVRLEPPLSAPCNAASSTPPQQNGDCSFDSPDPAVNDRIAIRRTFNDSNVDAALDPVDYHDCTGVDLRGTAGLIPEESVLVDVYWVERDSATAANNITQSDLSGPDDYNDVLKCVTYREDTHTILNPAQTIASGIEGLQVLYAVVPSNISGQAQNYRSLGTFGPSDMEMVHAIRISILTRAFSNFNLEPATRSYILLDAQPYTFQNDRVPRQIMTTTIALNNFE
jgi:Tfp pilus assembly protein PilW